ncbi:MAG: type III PLP-dependent enzyme [Deltaproteobacteria bacterium]|nr:type III PLP-dependent enzyme [Deltaproteobacteria bacterium]
MSAVAGQVTAERAARLVQEHGTPLLVTFQEVIERHYRALASLMPRVKIFYAVKANPDLPVLETLVRLGAGLDVASPGELELARSLAVPSSRLLYTQPIKKEASIALVKDCGIDLLVCDNAEEVRKVGRVYPGCGILLRIRVTNPYCVVDLSQKFGCDPGDVPSLTDLAASSGLVPRGLCFHVGSQTISSLPYVETLKLVRSLMHELALKGVDLDILDIGGGFPLAYLNPIISIDSFCEPVVNTLDHLFGGQQIYCEPGRFIVGNAATLLTRVVGKSVRDGLPWYYVDDGLYGTLSGKVYDQADYPVRTFKRGRGIRCVVAGPTCDSYDIAFKDLLLPDLDVGDVICIESVGAYTTASATAFNGMDPAKRIFIDKES